MIFVSHSSKDHDIAMGICRELEGRGISCWISSRDIQGGEGYQESIERAIRSASAMILVFSANANESPEIRKELALASSRKLTVVPVRAENTMPSGALEYELITRQWIDLFGDRQAGLTRLAQRIVHLETGGVQDGIAPAQPGGPTAVKHKSTFRLVIAGVAVLLLAVAAAAAFVVFKRHGVPPLRSTPAALTDGEVDGMLTRLNLYETDRNPSGTGIAHKYEPRVIADAVVVVDHATGLMWQKGQSDDGIGIDDAEAYVKNLNEQKYGGFTDWRLPTLEEAMTLVEPKRFGELHIAQQFKPEAIRIWTSDREANGPNRFEIGLVDALIFRAPPDSPTTFTSVWVRAVRRE